MRTTAGALLAAALLLGGACGPETSPVDAAPTPTPSSSPTPTLPEPSELTFHLVVAVDDPAAAATPREQFDPASPAVITDPDGGGLLTLGPALIEADGVAGAEAVRPPASSFWAVSLDFTEGPDGVDAWRDLVDQACGGAATDGNQRIAIVVNAAPISAPRIDGTVCGEPGSSVEISGDFTTEQAQQIAERLGPR